MARVAEGGGSGGGSSSMLFRSNNERGAVFEIWIRSDPDLFTGFEVDDLYLIKIHLQPSSRKNYSFL